MNYKKIFQIILIILVITGCSSENNILGGQCYQCETNADCNEDQICIETWPVDEQISETNCKSFTHCRENPCKTLDIGCGVGECSYSPTDYITCDCNEGVKTYKYTEYNQTRYSVRLNICLDNNYTCQSNDDCIGVFELNDDNEFTDLPICDNGKCISTE